MPVPVIGRRGHGGPVAVAALARAERAQQVLGGGDAGVGVALALAELLFGRCGLGDGGLGARHGGRGVRLRPIGLPHLGDQRGEHGAVLGRDRLEGRHLVEEVLRRARGEQRVELVEVAALEGGHRDDVDLLAVGLLVGPRGRGERLGGPHRRLELLDLLLAGPYLVARCVPLLGEGLGVALHLVELLLRIGRVGRGGRRRRGGRGRRGPGPRLRERVRVRRAAPVAAGRRAARGAAAHPAPPGAGSRVVDQRRRGLPRARDRRTRSRRPPGHRVGHGGDASLSCVRPRYAGATPRGNRLLPVSPRVARWLQVEPNGQNARRPCVVVRRSAD